MTFSNEDSNILFSSLGNFAHSIQTIFTQLNTFKYVSSNNETVTCNFVFSMGHQGLNCSNMDYIEYYD